MTRNRSSTSLRFVIAVKRTKERNRTSNLLKSISQKLEVVEKS
ncbi:MAG TPA: hypothetical protein VGS96_01460 [Thermoanaerobaculia bacterium]|nr:hypothetical protein [Thermoanaerobaculia bacterium]